jgi:hypothetical protein
MYSIGLSEVPPSCLASAFTLGEHGLDEILGAYTFKGSLISQLLI